MVHPVPSPHQSTQMGLSLPRFVFLVLSGFVHAVHHKLDMSILGMSQPLAVKVSLVHHELDMSILGLSRPFSHVPSDIRRAGRGVQGAPVGVLQCRGAKETCSIGVLQ